MAISRLAPTLPRPVVGDVDAGVIEDARARQRRHRAAAALVLAAIGVTALLPGVAGGGHGGGSGGRASHHSSGPAPANFGHLSNGPSAAAVASATASCNWLIRRGGPPTLTGKPLLIDSDGRFIAEIYVDGRVEHTCVSNGQHTDTSVATDNRILGFEPAPGPDQLGWPSGDGGRAPDFSGADQEENVQGRAGSRISAVEFEFADRSAVKATVQNGWYFAWWPGDAWPTTVTTTTGTKKTTSPVEIKACRAKPSRCVFTQPTRSHG